MITYGFWLFLFVIFYTYIGYPITIWIISKINPKPVEKNEITPSVSIVIAAYNEEKNIGKKIENCLQLDYPKDRLEIIIGSDCSTDRTNEIVAMYKDQGVICYRINKRSGKVNTLNTIVPKAKGEIIVFADARQIFEKNAIRELVNNFNDENVGCVSGELILTGTEDSSIAEGLGSYWEYEKFMRKTESNISSMIGATGAIYAIRKELYVPPDIDTILDDVYIPVKIVEQGFRAVFESNAVAYDVMSKTAQDESRRKIRTLAGNWQLFTKIEMNYKSFFSFQIISHKFLRIVAPYFLILVFVSNFLLIKKYLYKFLFLLQIFFYMCALLNVIFKRENFRLFNIPYTFCTLNIDAVRGFYNFVRNNQKVTWK